VWHSKKQATIKTSAFGAEFVTMKQDGYGSFARLTIATNYE
jgi:hypothetical protein